ERIEAVVSDTLSGPAPESGEIAVRPARGNRRFEPLPTAASGGRLVARWDSQAYPPGTYEFRATGYDTAGNAASGGLRPNRSRMVLVNPLKGATTIELGFSRPPGAKRPEPSPRADRQVGVVGSLRGPSGRALAGAPIQIVERFAPGAAVET